MGCWQRSVYLAVGGGRLVSAGCFMLFNLVEYEVELIRCYAVLELVSVDGYFSRLRLHFFGIPE